MAKVTARHTSRTVSRGGDVLTGQQVEALAAEAEAGYDLEQAQRQRVGRPSLESGISPKVSFRTSRALYEAARERAGREGRSVSALAREAMERFVTG